MSPASPPQPTPQLMAVERIPRTRLQHTGGGGKSIYVMLSCLALSIIGALAAQFYSKGGTAHLSSNAPGASCQVGGAIGPANASGTIDLGGVAFGTPVLQISHQDYEPVSTTISMGWLSRNRFSFQLVPILLTLTVITAPGAEVLLNGQSAGTANNQGVFVKDAVRAGEYDIEVDLRGYSAFHLKRHLSRKSEQLYANLNITAERARQDQEEQHRLQENALKVQQLIRNGQQQFGSRQYKAALASVDEALTLEPGNTAAQEVKNQIVQTMNILK